MAKTITLIAVELLPKKNNNPGELIAVCTNIREAARALHEGASKILAEGFYLRIESGDNAGRAANYSRILQSIKQDGAVTFDDNGETGSFFSIRYIASNQIAPGLSNPEYVKQFQTSKSKGK